MPDSQRRRRLEGWKVGMLDGKCLSFQPSNLPTFLRSGPARALTSWYRRRRMFLQDEQPFTHAAHRHHAALEERIVAPRPLEPRLIRSHGMRIEEADFFRMQAIGDVEHPQAAH